MRPVLFCRKCAVWKMTEDESVASFERAIYSTFCGNISQLLSVSKTWEDYLWAYTKGKGTFMSDVTQIKVLVNL